MKHRNPYIQTEVFFGDLEKAMLLQKRKINKDGVMRELKKKRWHLKPSEVRRQKRALARKRLLLREQKPKLGREVTMR